MSVITADTPEQINLDQDIRICHENIDSLKRDNELLIRIIGPPIDRHRLEFLHNEIRKLQDKRDALYETKLKNTELLNYYSSERNRLRGLLGKDISKESILKGKCTD